MDDPVSGAVHAVLVTFRRPAALSGSLGILQTMDCLSGELVVVDNGPDAATAELVSSYRHRTSRRRARYVAMGENTGAAGGLAAGVASVLEHAGEDDWILFLDDDDPPEGPNLVEDLHRAGEKLVRDGVGVAAIGIVGARFDRTRGELVRLSDDELQGMVPVDMIGGGQLPLYRVGALRRVGGPRAELFFGYDDLELGLRLRAAGFRIYAHGELWRRARLRHPRAMWPPSGRGEFKVSPWRTYYSTRNQTLLIREHCRRSAVARLIAKECVARPLLNLGRPGSVRQTMVTWRGVFDGLRGALGRRLEPDDTKIGR